MESLSDEILIEFLSKVSFHDLLSISRTNKRFYQLCLSNELWRKRMNDILGKDRDYHHYPCIRDAYMDFLMNFHGGMMRIHPKNQEKIIGVTPFIPAITTIIDIFKAVYDQMSLNRETDPMMISVQRNNNGIYTEMIRYYHHKGDYYTNDPDYRNHYILWIDFPELFISPFNLPSDEVLIPIRNPLEPLMTRRGLFSLDNPDVCEYY